MSKKIYTLLFIVVIVIFPTTVYAKQTATAKFSNILALIDFMPIPSYNIGGVTYIAVNDLNNYGFDVETDAAGGTVNVKRNSGKPYSDLTDVKFVDKADYKAGADSYPVYDGNIKVYLDGDPTSCLNVDGRTVIPMNAMSKYGKLIWNQDYQDFRYIGDTRPVVPFTFTFIQRGRCIALHMTYSEFNSAIENMPGPTVFETKYTVTSKVPFSPQPWLDETYDGQMENYSLRKSGLGHLKTTTQIMDYSWEEYIGYFKDDYFSGKGIYIDFQSAGDGHYSTILGHLEIGNFDNGKLNGFGVKFDPYESAYILEYGVYKDDKLTPDSAERYPNSQYFRDVVNGDKFMLHT